MTHETFPFLSSKIAFVVINLNLTPPHLSHFLNDLSGNVIRGTRAILGIDLSLHQQSLNDSSVNKEAGGEMNGCFLLIRPDDQKVSSCLPCFSSSFPRLSGCLGKFEF